MVNVENKDITTSYTYYDKLDILELGIPEVYDYHYSMTYDGKPIECYIIYGD